MTRIRVARLLGAIAVLCGHVLPASADLPVIRFWPDVSAPCDGTLQACVDGAGPGDTVEIATYGPISESPQLQKSLTLRAASGFEPLFAADQYVAAALTGTDSHSIDIEGLFFNAGAISVSQAASGPLTVRVVGNKFLSSFSNGNPAISLRTGGTDPVGSIALEVSSNTMTVPAGGNQKGIDLEVSNDSDASGRIADNVIAMEGSSQGQAIDLANLGGGSLSVDVIGNQIQGTDFDYGISVDQEAGSSAVRILDNLVIGQGGNVGGPGAIVLYATSGALTAAVVNNTIVNGEDGIYAIANGSATIDGLVANNIVSSNTHAGIRIDSALTETLLNRNNLVFANGADFIQTTPGPGTVTADPLFVDPHDDYRLQPGSPAIDAGDDASVPSDLATDLYGRPRILGSHVDMGAFEATGPLVWPGHAPCNATLQACVDATASGDEVQIARDGSDPIVESISFSKSLTLRAAPGFAPLFSPHQVISASTPDTGSHAITIEGLAFGLGAISVSQSSSDPLNVRIADNTLQSSYGTGIDVSSGASGGPVTFDVSGNAVNSQSEAIVVNTPNQDANGRIANNSIAMDGTADGAIEFLYGGPSSSVDVLANRVSGTGYSRGIGIVPQNANLLLTARILDNLVTGQSSLGTGPGAIVVLGSGAPLAATVVNNTVAGNDVGIFVNAAETSGLVANNIASGNAQSGITIMGVGATVLNRNNLVFGNGMDGFTPGPGTVSLDPLFVGNGDYHLQVHSPAIDAGDDTAVPNDLLTDLDGNPRIQGSHVDIGAYEAPEPAATLGTAASLSALGVLALRRRYLGPWRGIVSGRE